MRLASPYMRIIIVAGYALVLVTLLLISRIDGSTFARPFQNVLAQPTATPDDNRLASEADGPSEPDAVCRDEFEPDDERAEASEIYPDAPQNRAICPEGDKDWLAFNGIGGKVYTIDIPSMVGGLDLSLTLYDEAGEQLAFNDDFPRDDDPHDIKPRIQSWRVPDDGRYYIQTHDNTGHGGTGLTYTIILRSESYGLTPTFIAELCRDRFEPDESPELAQMILIHEVQRERTFCPGGDIDWVRFFARAGRRYVLRVDSKSWPGVDPALVVMDRDGASVLATMDEGTAVPRVEFQPPADGFYYAQLTNGGDIGGQFIKYDLYFEFADDASDRGMPGSPTPVPEPFPTSEPTLSPTPEPDLTPTPEWFPAPEPDLTPTPEASPLPAYPGPNANPTPLPDEPYPGPDASPTPLPDEPYPGPGGRGNGVYLHVSWPD